MPKRTDIKSILVIGAGPIVVGQASEFDYSGTQACRVLKEEGYRVVLANSNPATIMTDPNMADATYIEPLDEDHLTAVIAAERPDALLSTMGGQTALNSALALSKSGVLKKYSVEMIGADPKAIEKAESRTEFRKAIAKLGLDSVPGREVADLADGRRLLKTLGLPVVIRPSFTLGGTGSGIAETERQFAEMLANGLAASPIGRALVERAIVGWKEFEMEVVRDKKDNCIIVCSIENVDPMGVHTGDSITVAPALTLTDKEYQKMRRASFAVLREIGVETGGSNVQFAVNPADGQMVVIEMNPRVSRSSALASKATGFPIAKVATRLAVGYTLDELKNDITLTTPASFEPSIDYVVSKIPRFSFEKFPQTPQLLTSSMKSVGEVMAIGRGFAESLQKAVRSLENGADGLMTPPQLVDADKGECLHALRAQSPNRLMVIAEALRKGATVAEIHRTCGYDPWFINQIADIVAAEAEMKTDGVPKNRRQYLRYKQLGFADSRIAALSGGTVKRLAEPCYKRIDTCAGEFAAHCSYLYSTWEDGFLGEKPHCESRPQNRKKVVILGSGPARIGQGIEFDYCCVHASMAVREMGFESIMVNCNPETVSTDYDISDRLYFEPLVAENVLDILRKESENGEVTGVVIQLGGQTPLKLGATLEENGFTVLGTPTASIDTAEDRKKFSRLVTELGALQPANDTISTADEARAAAAKIGYPLVIRPSYVLGGRAMEIVYDRAGLDNYLKSSLAAAEGRAVLLDSFLQNAREVDVDALADGERVYIAAVMEHVERAGIHSGDSACAMPPHSLDAATVDELVAQTRAFASALKVKGLMNVQFAVVGNEVYTLEVNPRASRTVPFAAKVSGVPLAKLATQIMLGKTIKQLKLGDHYPKLPYVGVKEAVFPFSRYPGADVLLGPEMKSTGEVMGIADGFPLAFAKSQIQRDMPLPNGGTVFISVCDSDKTAVMAEAVRQFAEIGFNLAATKGTAEWLRQYGLQTVVVNKVREGSPHVVDLLAAKKAELVINTTDTPIAVTDSRTLRRAALESGTLYYTTGSAALAALAAIKAYRNSAVKVCSIQDYLARVGKGQVS